MASSSKASIIPLHHSHGSREAVSAPTTVTEKMTSTMLQESETSSNAASRLPSSPPPGYPKFAELMNVIPETTIFRRFGALNALNLLYLQAELIHIERDLRDTQISDNQSPEGYKSLYARNWYFLENSEQDGDKEQLQLVERAREKLEKYSK